MKPIRILRHHTHPLVSSFAARAALAVFAAGLASQTANAAPITVYWDGGSSDIVSNGNGASDGTAGTWNGTLLNWDKGASPHVAWDSDNLDTAYFGGTAGAVTFGAPATVGGISFNTDGYSVVGTGNTLTLGTIGSGVGTEINVATGTATINTIVAGEGFTKKGSGKLIYKAAGTVPNFASGGLTIDAGAIEFQKANNNITISGPLKGTGTLSFTTSGTLKFDNTTSDFSGSIIMGSPTGNVTNKWQMYGMGTGPGAGDITFYTAGTGGDGLDLELYWGGTLGSRKVVFAGGTALGANTIKFGDSVTGMTIENFENLTTAPRIFRFYGSSGSVGLGFINADLTDGVGTAPLSITTSFNGLWTLAGNNTFTGGITVSNSGATGLGNTIKIGGNGTLGYVSPGVGNYNGAISIAGPTGLFIVDSTATQTLGGVISNASPTNTSPGTLAKSNTGTLILTNNNIYTGETYVTAGTLIVNGSIASSALTLVENGATLGGTGTVGALTIDEGGIFSPGNSPGIQTVIGNYTQNGTLRVEIEGGTAGNGAGFHDRVNVTGEVTLGALSLLSLANFSGSYAPNDLIFLLLNDGTDAITGTFDGLAQGDVVSSYGGFDWQISYLADGDSPGSPAFTGGNDIALMAVAIPEPSVALLGGSGLLMLLRRRRK